MSRGLKSVAIFAAFVAVFVLSRHSSSPPSTTTTTATNVTTTSVMTTTSTLGTTCQGSDFTGVFNQGQGAAGTIMSSVTITQKSGAACTIDGWPLITLQDKSGAVLPSTSTHGRPGLQFTDSRANLPPSALAMSVGSTATFSFAYTDVQVGTTACVNAVTMSVQLQAGGSAITVTPAYPLQPCNNGELWISPLY